MGVGAGEGDAARDSTCDDEAAGLGGSLACDDDACDNDAGVGLGGVGPTESPSGTGTQHGNPARAMREDPPRDHR
jgi:hypothetical protein